MDLSKYLGIVSRPTHATEGTVSAADLSHAAAAAPSTALHGQVQAAGEAAHDAYAFSAKVGQTPPVTQQGHGEEHTVPLLPEAKNAAPVSYVRRSLEGFNGVGEHAAYSMLFLAQTKTLALMGTLGRAARHNVSNEALRSVGHLMQQIAGERQAAKTKLRYSFVAAMGAAGAGAVGTLATGSSRALGAGLMGSAQQIGGVISGYGDMADKTRPGSGTYQADEARKAQKDDENNKMRYQQIADSARSAYDQANLILKDILQGLNDYYRRQESLMSNIAGH